MEKPALVRSEILGLFVNTLTAEYKYCRGNMMKFHKQHQTLVSHKKETFYQFFIAFLKSKRNVGDFEKKDESPSLSISEIIDSKGRGY